MPGGRKMNWFPIVQRELLVAARSRRQFRLRMLVTVGGSVVCFVTMLLWSIHARRGGGGGFLFASLSSVFWLVCLASGIFLTADCISREKREGTLGLLFLTDLKGYDIILGKLVSSSWMILMILIGVMPVMALCVLMGGVTGRDVVRVFAGSVLTMIFSLSLGMLVSTVASARTRAGLMTFVSLILMGVGLPIFIKASAILPLWISDAFYILNFLSPALLHQTDVAASGLGSHFFYVATGVVLASLLLLLISCALVRRSWQDRSAPARTGNPDSTGQFRELRPGAGRLQGRVTGENPVLWLSGERRPKGWVLALVAGGLLIGGMFGLPANLRAVIPYVVALGIAVHASRFFVQTRRYGTLELLVSTPLTDQEILEGQLAALKRRYFPLALVLILIIWLPGGSVGPYPQLQSGVHGFSSESAARFYLMLKVVLLWMAAAWSGLYFGLKARRPHFAAVQAVLIGSVLPALSWCLPEIMVTGIVIGICHSKLDGRIRQSIRERIEAGQLV